MQSKAFIEIAIGLPTTPETSGIILGRENLKLLIELINEK